MLCITCSADKALLNITQRSCHYCTVISSNMVVACFWIEINLKHICKFYQVILYEMETNNMASPGQNIVFSIDIPTYFLLTISLCGENYHNDDWCCKYLWQSSASFRYSIQVCTCRNFVEKWVRMLYQFYLMSSGSLLFYRLKYWKEDTFWNKLFPECNALFLNISHFTKS